MKPIKIFQKTKKGLKYSGCPFFGQSKFTKMGIAQNCLDEIRHPYNLHNNKR